MPPYLACMFVIRMCRLHDEVTRHPSHLGPIPSGDDPKSCHQLMHGAESTFIGKEGFVLLYKVQRLDMTLQTGAASKKED